MNSRCQVCGTVLDPGGEGVRICPTCRGASHDECWNHLGGCLQPECRKVVRADGAGSGAIPGDRRTALVRRRLSWIVAQEMRLAPDFHPDERRYGVAALACVGLSAAAHLHGIDLGVQVFVPSTLLLAGLLALHRRQRRLGMIHRWIPAGSAPARALEVADWMLFVDEAGEGGRPLEQFGEDFLHGRREMELLEDTQRFHLLARVTVEGDKRMVLGESGHALIQEARARAAPKEVQGS